MTDYVGRWLQIRSCADAISKGTSGALITGCFTPKDVLEVLGVKGLLLAPVMASGEVIGFLHGEWNALVDVINGHEQYSIAITRAAAPTVIVDTEPIDANFQPRSGLTVAQAGTASSCEPGSDSVGNAYRCFSGNGVYDPCWADNGSPSTPSVVCQEAPWDTTVRQFTVPSGLQPFTENLTIDRDYPWGVQLTDGERCLVVQGAHDNYRLSGHGCGQCHGEWCSCGSCRLIGPQVSITSASAALAE